MAATNKSTRAGGYAPGSGYPPDKVAAPFTCVGREGFIWLWRSMEYVNHRIADARKRDSCSAVIAWAVTNAEHDDTTRSGELFAFMNQKTIAEQCALAPKTVRATLRALTAPDKDGWSPLREIPGHRRGDRSTATAYALVDYQARTTGPLEPLDIPGRLIPNMLHG